MNVGCGDLLCHDVWKYDDYVHSLVVKYQVSPEVVREDFMEGFILDIKECINVGRAKGSMKGAVNARKLLWIIGHVRGIVECWRKGSGKRKEMLERLEDLEKGVMDTFEVKDQ